MIIIPRTRMYFKNYSLHCPHLKPLNVMSNGCYVCQDCGKVLEPVYTDSLNAHHTNRLEKPLILSSFQEDLLDRICGRCYIDNAELISLIKINGSNLSAKIKKTFMPWKH